MSKKSDVCIVGAGVFGLTAAHELSTRGYNVTVLEAGPIPNPLASSTDISKVVRMEYGPDETYMELGEKARKGWLEWNNAWMDRGLQPLYHDSGVLMCCRDSMSIDGFEYESFRLLKARKHQPVRMSSETIERKYPAWNAEYFSDGFFNPHGGFVESGAVIERLALDSRQKNIRLLDGTRVSRILTDGNRVAGVDAGDKQVWADIVILAAGAWNGALWPAVEKSIRATGHPVFHFRPNNPELFSEDVFPTFTADVSRTGYYGFPLSREGVVKIGKHSLGVSIDPDSERVVDDRQVDAVRAFVSEAIPGLADAELVYTRLCLYADTLDEDFWIDDDPGCSGLFVAGGGSGHGFKFAPILGKLIADIVEDRSVEYREKFRWRPEIQLGSGREAARAHGIT